MRWLEQLAGQSAGDTQSGTTGITFLLRAGWRSMLRLAANHCIIPSLRILLFRWSGISIGTSVAINMGVRFLDGFEAGLITLEDEVSVAPMVCFAADSHPNNARFLLDRGYAKRAPIHVGHGTWIGAGAILLPGTVVGRSAIIGAGAVITSDVPDFAIMTGVPARVTGDVRDRQAQ